MKEATKRWRHDTLGLRSGDFLLELRYKWHYILGRESGKTMVQENMKDLKNLQLVNTSVCPED